MKNEKENISEFNWVLPKGHKNEFPDHPCLAYDSYYDWLDTFSDYHFDKYADDTNNPDINLSLKFRGNAIDNIMDEVLPFEPEQTKNIYKNDIKAAMVSSWYMRNRVGTMDHVGYKQTVDPEKHPTLQKIVDWFEFESGINPTIMEKNIGQWEGWHVDGHTGHPNGYRQKPLVRCIIHLQDWKFGQMMFWGTKPVVQWRAGDSLNYDIKVPHCTANCSRFKRYSLRLTGVPSENTLAKIAAGGEINVDLL